MQKIGIMSLSLALSIMLIYLGLSVNRVGKSISTDLSFTDKTATCSVYVRPEKQSDVVEVSIQLMCENTVVAEWNTLSGTGVCTFTVSTSVISRKTYTMKTTCSINGKHYRIADVTRKCE